MTAQIVGPVGFETHLLLDRFPSAGATKDIAGRVLAREERAAGSAYFAAAALKAKNLPFSIVTNTGNDASLEVALHQVGAAEKHDGRTGSPPRFTSLWSLDGHRALLIEPGDDCTVSTASHEATGVTSRLVMSLLEPESYLSESNAARKLGITDVYVPNQTLIGRLDVLEELMRKSDGMFLNVAEAAATIGSGHREAISRWMRSLTARATLIVTHGGDGVVTFRPDGTYVVVPRDARDVRRPLGGGDTLAALMFATWPQSLSRDGMADAIKATADILERTQPFPHEV